MNTRTLTTLEREQLESGHGVERMAVTCESDSGYGPCGNYLDWTDGRCSCGHVIEIAEEESEDDE